MCQVRQCASPGELIECQCALCSEVLEGASELRIMLCKEKRSGSSVGTSVVAACGAQPAKYSLANSCTSALLL